MTSIAERLVEELAARGVQVVFGLPGVHTVELYRGLAASQIRHVNARHEQGAGFMADGYARASQCSADGTKGRPGVLFVITGPGLTNALTAVAQARADSSPILVISAENPVASLGLGLGYLHELPAQHAMMKTVALASYQVRAAEDLLPALDAAFLRFTEQRPGPVHIEVPMDVMPQAFSAAAIRPVPKTAVTGPDLTAVVARLDQAKAPIILAGGGARRCELALAELAERLDAPVILTINGRGLMHQHPLIVPASPTLAAVREAIAASDLVLALGTELGPTDYDQYSDNGMPFLKGLVRVEICPKQLARHPVELPVCGCLETVLPALNVALSDTARCGDGIARAAAARINAWDEIGPVMRQQTKLLEAIREICPQAIFVGDSTQPVYAGNLFYDHDLPGGWFNSASGFGALGFAIPAAIGAALAQPGRKVICITGDGGAQFTLPELMVAMDEQLSVLFLVWNNLGYGEIESAMRAAEVSVIGCDPSPPAFSHVAKSCGIAFEKCSMSRAKVTKAVRGFIEHTGPAMIEIDMLSSA